MNKKSWIVLIVILVVLVSVGGLFSFLTLQRGDNESTKQSSSGAPPSVSTIPLESPEPARKDTIDMTFQTAGNKVSFINVTLTNPGYVVIHEDKNGEAGRIIGHSDLVVGSADNITVPLTRQSKTGELLHAVIHRDDGDKIYEVPGDDILYVDENEWLVSLKFLIFVETSTRTFLPPPQ